MYKNKKGPTSKVRLYEGLFLSLILGSLWFTTSLATSKEGQEGTAQPGRGSNTVIQLPSVSNNASPYEKLTSLQTTYLEEALATGSTALSQAGGQSGLYLSDLLGRSGKASNQDKMEAGNFWLLWLVAEVLERVEGGSLSLDTLIPYQSLSQAQGSSHLGASSLGLSYSLDQYLTWMIQDQDGEAAFTLLTYIGGPEVINQRLLSYGLYDSQLSDQGATTSLEDLGQLIQGMMQGSILARQSAYIWEKLALSTQRDQLGLTQDYAGLLWKADAVDQGVAGQALIFEGPNGPGLILTLVNQVQGVDLGQGMKKIHPAILDMYHKYWQNLTNLGTSFLKEGQVLATDTLPQSQWQWAEDPDQAYFQAQSQAWVRMGWLQAKNQLVTQGLRGVYQLGDSRLLWIKGQTLYLWNKISKEIEAIYLLTSLQKDKEAWTGSLVYWNQESYSLATQEVGFRQEGNDMTMSLVDSGLAYHLSRINLGQDQENLPWSLVYSPPMADWTQEILVDQQGGLALTTLAKAQGWSLDSAKTNANSWSYWDQAGLYQTLLTELKSGYSSLDHDQVLPYELTNRSAKLTWAYADLDGDGSLELLVSLDGQVRKIYTLASSRQGIEVVAVGPWAYYQWLGQGLLSWQTSRASVADRRGLISLWQGKPGYLMEWTWDPQGQTYTLDVQDRRMSLDQVNQELDRWRLAPQDWNSLLWYVEG